MELADHDRRIKLLQIEQRYQRLSTGQRRPSLEYTTPQEIRQIFVPRVKDPSVLAKMSDEDLLDLYTKWFDDHFGPTGQKRAHEMSLPEIEDFVLTLSRLEDEMGE